MAASRALIGAGLFGLALMAQAQTAATRTPQSPAQRLEEGLRRQEERARELQQQVQPEADVLANRPAASIGTQLPLESPCFPIKEVQLDGPDAGRFTWLRATAEPYLGQCAGVQGIGQIAAALDGKLLEFGYATSRVSLPQQNLKDGVLTFRLHVGRVARISMHKADAGKPKDDAWGTWWNAFPMSEGDILNIRDLEQGVEQMKRLPSQSVATELEPGEEPDTSNVRILRQSGTVRERLRGGLTLDNSGSEALGKTQLSGYAALDNPLGLNDILTVSVASNAERVSADNRSQSASISYTLPWGYNSFTLSKSFSRYAQVVQGTTVQFLSSGRSENTDLRWQRILLRTDAAKFGLYAALGTRRASSFLDDVELVVQRRRTTSFETGILYTQLLGNGSLDLELGHRRGMPWRDAQEDLPTAASGGLTIRPEITLLAATLNLPFQIAGRDILQSTTLRAQATRDLTLSIDQFAIGSQYTVRGFDGNAVLLAENGYFLRNEWSTPVRWVDGVNGQLFAGLDIGRVWGPSTAFLVGDRLAGAVVGVRGRWKQMAFDFAIGTPLHKPDGFRTRSWNPYLSISYLF